MPEKTNIHPVFHVSQLKAHLGKNVVPLPHVPLVTPDGKIKTTPFAILDTRTINRKKVPVQQWLVHWERLGPKNASWDDVSFIEAKFSSFQP